MRFSSAVTTIVTGMRNSITRDGSTSAPVTASASVTEWPTVNAVTTHTHSRQSSKPVDRREREQKQDVVGAARVRDVAEAQRARTRGAQTRGASAESVERSERAHRRLCVGLKWVERRAPCSSSDRARGRVSRRSARSCRRDRRASRPPCPATARRRRLARLVNATRLVRRPGEQVVAVHVAALRDVRHAPREARARTSRS